MADTALKVTAIDLEPGEIELDNVDVIQGNLEEIEIPEADVACSFETIEHLFKPTEFIKKLKDKISKFIVISVPFGCEKLIEVDGIVQSDLDNTHHAVFDTTDDVDEMFLDDKWGRFFGWQIGITYLAIYYNREQAPD